MEDCLRDPYWPLRIFGYAVWPSQLRISGLHARGAPRVPPSLRLGIQSMISSSTLGAWPNIATTLRRSFNVCGSSTSSSKLRNAHVINHPYNSWVIILTVVAFGWTRGRWRPLRPGHNPQPSKNFNASWDSPTSTAASYRITVPLPIHSRT